MAWCIPPSPRPTLCTQPSHLRVWGMARDPWLRRCLQNLWGSDFLHLTLCVPHRALLSPGWTSLEFETVPPESSVPHQSRRAARTHDSIDKRCGAGREVTSAWLRSQRSQHSDRGDLCVSASTRHFAVSHTCLKLSEN